jgi:S1-C subfamily serine protease
MDARAAAAIMVGVIAAATPALAQDSHQRKPAAQRAGQSHVAALPSAATADSQAGKVRRHRTTRATHARSEDKDADLLAAPVNFTGEAVGWRLIEDPATGARLGLPTKLVPQTDSSRTGSRWTSAQGQIQIETFRLTEAALPALFEQEKKISRRQIVSSELKGDSFAITGVQGLKNFLVRADAQGSEIRGFTVLYDQATEGTMERVAAAMAGTFAGFPDPNSGAVAGIRRTVEYGTAIVVGSSGDLLAPAHVTDDCQTITVPPLGHAERVAEDKVDDLALLRLYGVRNLVAAPFAARAPVGDMTLVGVADPLAQAGAADVTSTAAHLSAQGLEPAPKLGFSGAAAVDAQGHFAGMADMRPPIVAGGAANQGAALVPVEAIRSFLQAHGVTPVAASSEPAPLDQSVMRVICVRK